MTTSAISASPISNLEPVFVTGIGRSGTSALLKSIARHKHFIAQTSFGEAPFIHHFAQFLRDYEDLEETKTYNLASYKVDQADRYRIFYEMLYRLHVVPVEPLEVGEEKKYWAAKTTLREDTYSKLHSIFRSFKTIYIIRNGIEVVNSSRNFAGFRSLDFVGLCSRWKSSLAVNRFLESKGNCAVIRHEDLVDDPHAVLAQAFERVGLPQDRGPAEFLASNIFNSSFSPESKTMENSNVFKTRLTNAWSTWNNEEREMFLAICGDEMKTYGFTVPTQGNAVPWTQRAEVVSELVQKPITSKKTKSLEFTPIPCFAGDMAAAGGVAVKSEIDASSRPDSFSSVKAEVERRIGVAVANYCIHPVPALGLLYVEIPKAACTPIKYLMQSLEREYRGEIPREFTSESVHRRNISPLPETRALSEENYAEVLRGGSYFRFSIVRNPFERILSTYLSKIAKNLPQKAKIVALRKEGSTTGTVQFQEFIQIISTQSSRDMDIHWRPQVDQLLLGLIDYDFIGRYERLYDSLGYLKARCFPSSRLMLPSASNATNSSDLLGRYYDQRTADLVRALYARDFEMLDYSLDIEVPKRFKWEK